jgi:hypothetical protein
MLFRGIEVHKGIGWEQGQLRERVRQEPISRQAGRRSLTRLVTMMKS